MSISETPARHSVREIAFPAVIACQPSRFSRKRLVNFTDYIYANQNKTSEIVGETWNETYDVVRSLIYAIDLSMPTDFSGIIRLHAMLTEINNGSYSLSTILTSLSSPCNELVKACYWQDDKVNCSETFTSRRTYMHQCCSFNYQRPTVQEFWQVF